VYEGNMEGANERKIVHDDAVKEKSRISKNTGGLLLIYGIATAWRKKGGGKDA